MMAYHRTGENAFDLNQLWLYNGITLYLIVTKFDCNTYPLHHNICSQSNGSYSTSRFSFLYLLRSISHDVSLFLHQTVTRLTSSHCTGFSWDVLHLNNFDLPEIFTSSESTLRHYMPDIPYTLQRFTNMSNCYVNSSGHIPFNYGIH